MTRADDELTLLLIDGDNLLHRLRGGRDDAGLGWLIPRLRATLATGSRAVVMLDGHPDPGQPARREVTPGVEFRHSMRTDADTAILEILAARPFDERAATAVVTDDRALTERTRRAGGMTRRLDWLRRRLEHPETVIDRQQARRPTGLGQGRAPRAARPNPDPDRAPWRPGRGATRKRGNPRRGERDAGAT
jgi:hypothetical protein